MKKFFLLFLLAILSCSRDDIQSENISIIGTWKLIKSEKKVLSTGVVQTNTPIGCSLQDTHEFQANKVISTHYHLVNNSCVGNEVVTRNYTLDLKNSKFWYEGEENYPYLINKLTETELVIDDKYGDSDDDGVADFYITFYFQK